MTKAKKPAAKTSKPQKSKKTPKPLLSPSTGDDDTCLSRFCDSVQLDEISVQTWETCMSALDVSVPLFVTAAEADVGGEKTVRYSRSVAQAGDARPRREPSQVQVILPPKAADGLQLKCSGLGDVKCAVRGDLLVIVRIKR